MFSSVIVNMITNYLSNFEILSWICKNKLNSSQLSLNENAIKFLTQNQDKINWDLLSSNPNAIDLLQQNKDKINWNCLSLNSSAISILEKKPR